MGLSWLQVPRSLVAGDAPCHDSEHAEMGNKNDVCIVIQLRITVAKLGLCCDFSMLLYHSDTSKSHVGIL